MTPRRWENIAKYLFDISKITMGTSVVTKIVAENAVNWNSVAFGLASGVALFIAGVILDKKGDTYATK